MAFHVVYRMIAREGAAEALHEALIELKARVSALREVTRVELLTSLDKDGAFLFMESWPSKDAYGEGAKALSKSVFEPLKKALGEPPAREEFSTPD